MDLKKITTKVVSGALASALVLSSAVPALAAVEGNPVYEAVPADGARFYLVDGTLGDTNADLADLYMDLDPAHDMDTYDKGTWTIFGNGDNDDDGADSFDDIVLEFADIADVDAVGYVVEDMSNSNNVNYDVVLYNNTADAIAGGDPDTGYKYTEVDETPSLSVSRIEDMLEDAVADGTTTSDVTETGNTVVVTGDTGLEATVGSSNQQVGDPDVLTDYMGKVWFYIEMDGEQRVFMWDMELGSADQGADTDEVRNLSVKARATRTRIEYQAPEMTDGMIGYQVEVVGDVDLNSDEDWDDTETVDGIAGIAEGTGIDYFTHGNVVFVTSKPEESYDVTVYTLNAEGDTSADGVEEEDVDADRVDLEADLSDINMDDNVFYHNIAALYKAGIVDGYSSGEYGTDDPVTRGQLAKFVVNAFDIPFDLSGEMFSDVDADNVFAAYIQTLKNAGIINGYSDGTYRSDVNVDRGQASKYIHMAANYYDDEAVSDTGTNCFPDLDGNVFAVNVCALAEYNEEDIQPIIKGYSDGEFKPEEVLNRGAMAKFVHVASASVIANDGGADDEAFFNLVTEIGTLVRIMIAPVAVENFDAGDETEDEVNLSWDSLIADDSSVDGYVVERKESDDESWDRLDLDLFVGTITVGGMPADGDSLDIGDCAVSFAAAGADDLDCTGGALINVTDNSTVAEVADRIGELTGIVEGASAIELNQNGTVITVSDTAATFTLVENVVDADFLVSAVTDMSNNEGIIAADLVELLDTDVTDDTSYDYRIAAFKFVPYQLAEEEYDGQTGAGGLEEVSEYDVEENFVWGEWDSASATTDENP